MKLNEYGISEYAQNPYLLDALAATIAIADVAVCSALPLSPSPLLSLAPQIVYALPQPDKVCSLKRKGGGGGGKGGRER